MSLPDPLRTEAARRLAEALTGAADDGQGPAGGPLRSPLTARVRGVARRVARRAAKPVLERAAEPGRRAGQEALHHVADLEHSLSSVRADAMEWEMERTDLRAGLVNLELLKGEVRGLGEVLDHLGRAIAPAFGLSAAATALAELRERVTACERRLRFLESGAGSRPADPTVASTRRPEAEPASTLFDYAGFERRFRGRPEEVLAALDERYGALLQAHPPVLDIGCGRAELIGLLAGRGVEAIGVDTDPSMVADAHERGLSVVRAEAVSFLRDQPPGTFGAIVATHLLEHLQLDPLIELLELSQTRLRPGGVFIAETPNPASLIVLGNSYILDPTHVRPLHPKLLEFLCEAAGFRDVEVRFFAPASAYHLGTISDPEAPPWTAQVNQAFEQLNDVLFGPQDFAVVATTAAAAGDPDSGNAGG